MSNPMTWGAVAMLAKGKRIVFAAPFDYDTVVDATTGLVIPAGATGTVVAVDGSADATIYVTIDMDDPAIGDKLAAVYDDDDDARFVIFTPNNIDGGSDAWASLESPMAVAA